MGDDFDFDDLEEIFASIEAGFNKLTGSLNNGCCSCSKGAQLLNAQESVLNMSEHLKSVDGMGENALKHASSMKQSVEGFNVGGDFSAQMSEMSSVLQSATADALSHSATAAATISADAQKIWNQEAHGKHRPLPLSIGVWDGSQLGQPKATACGDS